MNFFFGSDTNENKNQPNSKSKNKELKVQITFKDDEKKQKTNIIGEKFKIQAKKQQEDHQNPTFSEQQHDVKYSEQNNIRKTNQQAPFQNHTKQKQKTQQNQLHQTQIQNKSPTLRSSNLVKRIRTKVTDKSSNKSPINQKKVNQLKAPAKLPQQKIKSVKATSPKKVQKLVTPIRSSKLISPSINKKRNQQKPSQVQKNASPSGAKKIKDLTPIKQIKKKEFSTEEKPKLIPKKKTLEQSRNYGKSHSVTKPKQGIQLYPSNMNNMNIEESIKQQFQNELYNSERGMKFLEKKFIGDKLNDSENVVYNAVVSEKPNQYLKGMYQNIYLQNQYIKSGVDETINHVLQNVSNRFQGQIKKESKRKVSKRIAPKNKDDLKELQKIDRVRLLKIKQGQVKSKVGDLRNELQKQYFINKSVIKIEPIDALMPDYYSIDHPKTIQAQNLIRSLQQKRKSQHRQYQQHLSQKEIQKQRIKQIEKEYEEKFKQERRQRLKQFYEQKHQERELQKLEMKKKQEEFKEWIKIYERERPLEEKFQEEMVLKMIIPEIQDRHRKLMKIKESRKPIDIEDINEHEKRYMDFKKDEIIRQRAQLQSQIESDSINEQNVNRHFKGKYRYLVLESMYQHQNQTDPKQIQRSKKLRQLSYSDQVRYVHQSLIKKKSDQNEDTRTLVRRVRNYDGSVDVNKNSRTIDVSTEISSDRHPKRNVETIDAYAEGLKNLQYAKSHVRQKLMNGQEKKPKIQLIQIRQKFNYLDELKEKRLQNSLQSKNHENSDKIQSITGKDIESIRARIEGMDQKLKRKEQKNKYKHPRDQNPLSNRQIENDYLDSINAKLKMVQELK